MNGEMMETGINGFDELLNGGLTPRTSLLVTGGPGVGKSIFGLQFIIEGARKFNEPGIYITVEETAEDIREYTRRLGWDINELEEKNLVKIIEQPVVHGSLVSIEYMEKVVKENNTKRLVLDSLTLFNYMYGQQQTTLRTEMMRFIKNMRSLGVTLFVISDRYTFGLDDVTYSHEDFIFQGIVLLMKLRMQASYERCLNIVKLRGVDHSMRIHSFKIGEGGITVLANTTPFALVGPEEARE